MKKFLISIIFVLLLCHEASAATKYILCPSLGGANDGGTGYDATHNSGGQCNGSANTPYDGSGTNENCAWNNYLWAVGWKDGSYPAKVTNGDIIVVTGDCEVGYNADGNSFASTDSAYPWDAYPKALPDGVTLRGSNYATCDGIEDTAKFYGIERVARTLNLEGTENGLIQCLTVSDKEECGEFHPNGALACERDSYPYGDWSPTGIYALDSANMLLDHVYAVGLAGRGGYFSRVEDWTWTYGSISGNPSVGWDGDLGDPDDWANGGTITIAGDAFDKFEVDWNGCVANHPYDGTMLDDSCYTQGQGNGYGDGFAPSDLSGDLSGAHYVFDHVQMNKNTSDGLDLLYHPDDLTITITNSEFAHNTGNQIKTAGNTLIDATKVVSECDYFAGKAFEYTGDGGFTHCRAAGNAVSWAVAGPGNTLDIYGSTITGKGDVLIISSGADGNCNGTERVRARNVILQGTTQYGGGDTTDDYYASGDINGNGDGSCGVNEGGLPIDWSTSGAGNIIYATKNNDTGAGISNSDPLLGNIFTDLSIGSSSPARGLRNVSFGSSVDFNDFPRDDASGALEFDSEPTGGGGPTCDDTCSECADQTTCEASPTTCYWYSSACNSTPPPAAPAAPKFIGGVTISGGRF